MEDALIRWTARLAVACYVIRLLCDAADSPSVTSSAATGRRDTCVKILWLSARGWWTLGCLFFLAHVTASYQLLHHWSHSAAYEHVRQRTLQAFGWNSGFGIYVNDTFTILWLVDTLLWWSSPNWPRRRLPYWTVQSVFAFLMFQSTVVFGPPIWKPIFVAVILVLITLRLTMPSRKEHTCPNEQPIDKEVSS